MQKADSQETVNECPPTGGADLQARYQVICICTGSGFPFGAADAPRIISVGKALQKAGIKFRVLHCGPSPIAANKDTTGIYEGIRYEYTTFTTKRPVNRILRILLYTWGISILAIRLIALYPQRRRSSVYVYIQSGPIGVIAAGLSRILRIPVVQEVNEWFPGTETPNATRFTDWLYSGPMFSLSNGALVISALIEKRVRAAAQRLKRPLIIQRTPILVDINDFHAGGPGILRLNEDIPQFAWCGGVAAYPKDIDFMIRALSRVVQKGMKCQLTIVGGVREEARRRVMEYAQGHGVAEDVVLTGYIDDDHLDTLYRSAAGLLLPLFDDDRSRTRMPTKLGGYLASGTPVITCNVGDLTYLLSHGRNAYISAPGDDLAFAENMCSVLHDRVTARKIGAAGRHVCEAEIHYEVHSARLADFFSACIRTGQ
jgi:glycosyltransferase involved in cell wall biosynthesis